MVKFCAVYGCTSSGHPFTFYGIPKVKTVNREHKKLAEARRSAWFKALHRTDITEYDLDTKLVCNRHFVSGKPALLFETDDPDWAPSLNLPGRRRSLLDSVTFSPKKPYSPIRKPINQDVEGSSTQFLSSFLLPEKLNKPNTPVKRQFHHDAEGSSASLQNFSGSPEKLKKPNIPIKRQSHHDATGSSTSLQNSSKSPEKLKKPNIPIKRQSHHDAEASSTSLQNSSKSPVKLKIPCVRVPKINVDLYIQPSTSVRNELTNGAATRTPIPNSVSNSKAAPRRVDAQTQTDLSGEYMDELQRKASQYMQLKQIMGRFKGSDISIMTQVRVKLERIC